MNWPFWRFEHAGVPWRRPIAGPASRPGTVGPSQVAQQPGSTGPANVHSCTVGWSRTNRSLFEFLALMCLVGCGPVTPSLDIDGGFPDAQVVVVPPTRVADNGRDEHLFLSIGFTPATDVPGRFDVTAYDPRTGMVQWTQSFDLPFLPETVSRVSNTVDPRDGSLAFSVEGEYGAEWSLSLDVRARTVASVELPWLDDGLTASDVGWLRVHEGPRIHDQILLRADQITRFEYVYQPNLLVDEVIVQPEIPYLSMTRWHRGSARTLVVDGIGFGEPVLQRDGFGDPAFFVFSIEDGTYDVYVLEPETGALVGTGRRVPPPGVAALTNGVRMQLVDRDGRRYYRDGDYVNADPIYRAGMDGTTDEVVLHWGDAGSCLLTRIVAVGPEGHILSRQRPEPGWPMAPDGVICLFGPDGELVLSLPADPQRVWAGFSDPIQWL